MIREVQMSRPLRGFAAIKAKDPARLLDICRSGGLAAHQQGVAYRWSSASAKRAGRRGGQVAQAQRRARARAAADAAGERAS